MSKDNMELWRDVIEEDRQWDFTYLEKIILHKVKLMRNFYLEGHSNVVQESVDKTIEEMTVVIEALERLVADDYIHYPEGMRPKYSFEQEEDSISRLKIEYHPEFGEDRVDELYKLADELRLKDRALVYDTLRDKSTNWWD